MGFGPGLTPPASPSPGSRLLSLNPKLGPPLLFAFAMPLAASTAFCTAAASGLIEGPDPPGKDKGQCGIALIARTVG